VKGVLGKASGWNCRKQREERPGKELMVDQMEYSNQDRSDLLVTSTHVGVGQHNA